MTTMEAIKSESSKSYFYLFPMLCKGCGLCVEKCPTKTLAFSEELGLYGTPAVEIGHSDKDCNGCGICAMFCPDCAIIVEKK